MFECDKKKMGMKGFGVSRKKVKLWIMRAATSLLVWTCVVQLMTSGETWGTSVLKGWPSGSCRSRQGALASDEKTAFLAPPRQVLPPKSKAFSRSKKKKGLVMECYFVTVNLYFSVCARE